MFQFLLLCSCLSMAFGVILSANTIHSVFFLITTFLFSCIFLFLNGAYFFASILLIVYVGAVAVLFLFVIMMLETKKQRFFAPTTLTFKTISLIFYLFFCLLPQFFFVVKTFAETSVIFTSHAFLNTSVSLIPYLTYLHDDLQIIGFLLYTYFWFIFCFIGFLLFLIIFLVINITQIPQSHYNRQLSYLQIYRNYDIAMCIVS